MSPVVLTYLVYALVSVALTVWVGSTLSRHGEVFLLDVFAGSEALAAVKDIFDTPELRAELLSQAGNAWLLAHEAGQARSAFTRAITTVQGNRENLPDLLIDRATAFEVQEPVVDLIEHVIVQASRVVTLAPAPAAH